VTPMSTPPRDPERSQSVDRAVEVLRVLGLHGPLRLADLVTRIDAPRRAIQRLLNSLEQVGHVQRDPVTKRYDLGIGIAILGQLAAERVDLARIAPPFLRALLDETHQTGLLLVRQGPRAVSAHVEAPQDGPAMVFPVGRSIPLWRGAARAILAFLDPAERAELVADAPDSVLPESLEDVRDHGYAIGHAEVLPGAIAVGAPVFDPGGGCVACVAALGSDAHLDPSTCAPVVRRSAADLSRALGHTVR
jgi:DNA-binding IclR family transcriptional regulator